jgi:HK97 gp10 family phage protein
MPDTIQVKLEGGEELLEALRAIDANIKGAVKAATLAAAQPILDMANGLAPGPHVIADVVSVTTAGAEVAIGPDAEHWYYRFHETGAASHEITAKGSPLQFEGRDGLVRTARVSHPGMAARPFLRPAQDSKKGEATDEMGARLRIEIEKVKG